MVARKWCTGTSVPAPTFRAPSGLTNLQVFVAMATVGFWVAGFVCGVLQVLGRFPGFRSSFGACLIAPFLYI